MNTNLKYKVSVFVEHSFWRCVRDSMFHTVRAVVCNSVSHSISESVGIPDRSPSEWAIYNKLKDYDFKN